MLFDKNIKYLVVHCSDTENDEKISATDIHKMHLSFGWDGIGYHKIINRSGKVEDGRPEYWIGAHVKGKNDISLGVCLVGKDSFTKRQFQSLVRVIKKWKIKYPNAKIVGHRDIGKTKKTCPNFNVIEWSKKIFNEYN